MKHKEFRNRVAYTSRNKELVAENEAMKLKIRRFAKGYKIVVKKLLNLRDKYEDVAAELEFTEANLKELHKGYTNICNENMELAQRVHQLVDDYNDVVRQLNGKETHKDEDPAKLLLVNMQKMRDHCDMLEKDNEQLKRQCIQLQIERNEAKTHAEQCDLEKKELFKYFARFNISEFLKIGDYCTHRDLLPNGKPVKVGSAVCRSCRHIIKVDVSGKKCVLCAYCYDNKKAEEAQECKNTDKKD